MTFAFKITLLTGDENGIDDLRDCTCRSPAVLPAAENPRFILSRLEAGVGCAYMIFFFSQSNLPSFGRVFKAFCIFAR